MHPFDAQSPMEFGYLIPVALLIYGFQVLAFQWRLILSCSSIVLHFLATFIIEDVRAPALCSTASSFATCSHFLPFCLAACGCAVPFTEYG